MMRRITAAAFAVSQLDAATTYIIITTGRGVEANPLLYFLNAVPEAAFFVQILVLFGLAVLLKIFEILAAALPTALKTRVYGTTPAALQMALEFKNVQKNATMQVLERKKTKKKRRHVVRGQIAMDIREGVGAFVVLIIAAAAIAIAGGVANYILNALGPATDDAVVAKGSEAIHNTMSAFVTVATLLGGLVIGVIAFGFLKRIWKEFAS